MRHLYQWVVPLAVFAGGAAFMYAAEGRADGPATYTNAQVVAVDVMARTLVIRSAEGAQEKVQLDDNLAGLGEIKAGDRVTLTLRTGSGWARVSSIVRSRAVPAPEVAERSSPSPPVPVENPQALASREAFGAQVASLAGEADRVDRLWNEFRKACSFQGGSPHEGARGWFVIWEGSIPADLSGGFCRHLLGQIIELGEPVNAGMTAAEEVAQRTLSPGDIREIRRQYRMDWDGWALTPPKPLER